MITIEEFHADFVQSVMSSAESREMMPHQAFFEMVAENLVENGDLTVEYATAECIKRNLEIHGYDIDEERKMLTLINHEYFQEDSIQTISRSAVEAKFSKLLAFFELLRKDDYKSLEESSDAFAMALTIRDAFLRKAVDKVRLMVLTDGKLTKTIKEIPEREEMGLTIERRVVDIDYIFKMRLADFIQQDFVIDVDLPCLAVHQSGDEYESYLMAIPGSVLYDIYDQFGQKLFEQNVRTFLQFKGKVNKGIRNTIEYAPEKFFAYNNGITATASGVHIGKNGCITQIRNLQIVNGGQTTSSIYAARKVLKKDISKVTVQMKLSVVKEPDALSDFVAKVARHANTQNKVNDSDFFSNSLFHKDMKTYSKTIRVATVRGSQRQTHWYYERTRGEYLNEQAYLTQAQKKQFQLENPKSQLMDKTFLAKCEMSWHQYPQIVSRGAQYAFNKFADVVTKKIEEDTKAITEAYFKHAVAKVLLFRDLETLVSKADWYDGGFRAQIVAYSMALLSRIVTDSNNSFNFTIIWDKQEVPEDLRTVMRAIAKLVHEDITKPAEGTANIAQWCKKDACWERVKKLSVGVAIPEAYLLDRQEIVMQKASERKEKTVLTGIQIQTFVVNQSTDFWKSIFDHYSRNGISSGISRTQMEILHSMTEGRIRLPSEAQSRRLYEVYQMAILDGVEGLKIVL
jgi:hypothetical protein